MEKIPLNTRILIKNPSYNLRLKKRAHEMQHWMNTACDLVLPKHLPEAASKKREIVLRLQCGIQGQSHHAVHVICVVVPLTFCCRFKARRVNRLAKFYCLLIGDVFVDYVRCIVRRDKLQYNIASLIEPWANRTSSQVTFSAAFI